MRNGCVRIVKQIARQVRKLRDDLHGYVCMSLCRDEDTEPRRREQRHNGPGPLNSARAPGHRPE